MPIDPASTGSVSQKDVAALQAAMGVVIFDRALAANGSAIDTGPGGIPPGHAALLVIVTARTSQAAAVSTTDVGLQLNGDAGANYFYNDMTVANGVAGPGSNFGAADTGVLRVNVPGSNAAAGNVGIAHILFHNYDNTNWNKIGMLTSSSFDSGTAANSRTRTASAFWLSTAAINQIALISKANQLLAGSRITIFAIG